MKILMLNYEFPPLGGGAAPVSKELAMHLAKRGYEVDVVTMGFRNLPAYEVISGVNIYRVKCLRTSQSFCQPWEQYTYLLSARKLIRKLMNEKMYDFCHVHFVVPTGILGLSIKKRYGLLYVITAHGSDVEGYNTKISNRAMHRFIRPIWKKIIENGEYSVAPSNYLLKMMKNRFPGGVYSVIPNGIDLEKFRIDNSVKKEKRILFSGRLQKSKNVQTILRAVSQINMKDWVFEILGDGPYRRELEQLAGELGISGSVRFQGWVSNGSEKHISSFQRAALFISESYFESFGVAVVEAVASGCSIILSDIEAHRMLVAERECFTDPDNIELLAEKIRDFIDGKEKFQVDVAQIEKYEWERVTDQYEELYNFCFCQK